MFLFYKDYEKYCYQLMVLCTSYTEIVILNKIKQKHIMIYFL